MGRSALWEGQTASFQLTLWRSSALRPRRTRRNSDALLVDRFPSSLALAPISFMAPRSIISGMTFWMQTTGSIRQSLHQLLRQESGKMILVERSVAQSLRIERSSSFPMKDSACGCRKRGSQVFLAIVPVQSSEMHARWQCRRCSLI